MTSMLQSAHQFGTAVFNIADHITADVVAEQRKMITALVESSGVKEILSENRIVLSPNQSQTIVRQAAPDISFEERIFSALVSLKVAISQYAMHLSPTERSRLFAQLDAIINVDDWHEEDKLPTTLSFKEFLKWMIYSKYFSWTSIGVSDDGNIMVAWRSPRVLLTANFDGSDSVRWTATIRTDAGEVGHAVGKCSVKLFSEQALFYLRRASQYADQ